ncbi:hypothetical protein ACFVUS_29650 [Nocardia sp. NPDC058058]|uniref:hypothetical protein n=1 Tax=Nocardia sp. NPDC058058 TaxID=3346317 RepID=UPI0036D7F02C
MGRGLWISLVLSVGLSVSGCGVVTDDERGGDDVFAYRTDRELVLAAAAGTIVRVPVGVDDDPNVDFTLGRDVAFTVTGKTIVGAAAARGSFAGVPCDCRRAFPQSGSRVVWWRGPDTIMSVRLDPVEDADAGGSSAPGLAPKVLRTVVFPDMQAPLDAVDTVSDDTEIVAASPMHIVLNRLEHRLGDRGTVNHLYSVDLRTGAVHSYGTVPEVNMPLRNGVHQLFDSASPPTGPDHFYVLGEIRTDTSRSDVVLDIDTTAGTIVSSTPVNGAQLVNLRGESGGIAVTASPSTTSDRPIPLVWQQHNGRWSQERDEALLDRIRLPGSDSATLDLIPADSGRANLCLNQIAGSKQLATNVVSIAVAPAVLRL